MELLAGKLNNVSVFWYNSVITKKEGGVMLISEILEGKLVKSSQGEGNILRAVKREDIWLQKGQYAYAVNVESTKKGLPFYFWTTIYVGVDK
jgi:hypothetical protein